MVRGPHEIHLAQWPFFDTSWLWLAKQRTEVNEETQRTLPWARPRICQQSRVQRIFELVVASGLLFLIINGPILCKILYYYFESIYISWLPQHPVTLIMLRVKILLATFFFFFFFNSICQNFI